MFTSGMRYEVERNKAVLERLIDITKLIGKLGLSYRGAKDTEAAYTLNDSCELGLRPREFLRHFYAFI